MAQSQRFPASSRNPAAVDDQSMAVHEATHSVVRQKQDRFRYYRPTNAEAAA